MTDLISLEVGQDFLDRFERICEFLGVEPDLNVTVFECSSLEEFNQMTGMGYHIGAVYVNGVVYTQPFAILKKKECFEDIILHELLHHVLQLNFHLPHWAEEGIILTLLGTKPEEIFGYHRECLLRFSEEVTYEEIPHFVDRYRRSHLEHR
ncbi:hypothetical protein AS005_00280 [Thermotoga sp. KOL6]|nr:hypothetical protein AS005_00280 [Thermotoga sp. KOL6]